MSAYADFRYEPIVIAAPGYFFLEYVWSDEDPEPVLAWRVGDDLALPVTRFGCQFGDSIIPRLAAIRRRRSSLTFTRLMPDFSL